MNRILRKAIRILYPKPNDEVAHIRVETPESLYEIEFDDITIDYADYGSNVPAEATVTIYATEELHEAPDK